MTENAENTEARVDLPDPHEAPPWFSCPECGTREYSVGQEGNCHCKNGHHFWDTNSWEWKILRRAQAAERRERDLRTVLQTALSSSEYHKKKADEWLTAYQDSRIKKISDYTRYFFRRPVLRKIVLFLSRFD